jgi:phenylacetate-CoA ligase
VKLADQLYKRLPVPLQHAAVTAFSLGWTRRRFGGRYRQFVSEFIARERFTAEQWQAWQTQELRKVLHLAATRVPFYRRAWKKLGLDERRIERFTIDDLSALPILEKEDVRAAPEDFLIDGLVPRNSVICPTSGSSGTPIRTYWTNEDFQRSLALRETRECRPAGVSYAEPRATFSGRLVEPDPDSKGPFHRFNAVEHQVYFSAFHLAPQNARAYVEPLARHHTVWGTGYTHSFEQLGRMMLEQGIPPPPALRAIITTSEKVMPAGRETIERAFGCRVFQEYGMVEDVTFACEHADGRMRVSPDAGVMELVDADGARVAAGLPGQVVATGFMRRSQLFIRYRVGDVAVLDTAPDDSGFAMPIFKEIVGRVEDVVHGPDGRRTVRFHGVFTEVPGVREAQLVQEAIDRIRIRVVPSKEYGDATAHEIVARVQQRLGSVTVIVERVDSIARTKAGKFRAVVSLVGSEHHPDVQEVAR